MWPTVSFWDTVCLSFQSFFIYNWTKASFWNRRHSSLEIVGTVFVWATMGNSTRGSVARWQMVRECDIVGLLRILSWYRKCSEQQRTLQIWSRRSITNLCHNLEFSIMANSNRFGPQQLSPPLKLNSCLLCFIKAPVASVTLFWLSDGHWSIFRSIAPNGWRERKQEAHQKMLCANMSVGRVAGYYPATRPTDFCALTNWNLVLFFRPTIFAKTRASAIARLYILCHLSWNG